jgi:zinc D-Ala-D-Ala carboxypeptidase
MVRDLTATPHTEFSLTDIANTDIVAKYFQVKELVRSDLAVRRGLKNWFESDQHLQSAVYLARQILAPLQDQFGPFSPNSVYRCQVLERILKGKRGQWSSKSQHARGEAADVEIQGITNRALAEWIKTYLPFDQLILECYDPAVPGSGWVHVSAVEGKNRGQVLSYILQEEQWAYVPGLVDNA